MLSIDVRPREAEGQQTGVIIGVSLPLVVIIGLLSLALTLFAVVARKRKKKIVEDTHLQQGLGKY